MLYRTIRSLVHWVTKSSEPNRTESDSPQIDDMIAQMREFQDKRWWKDLTGLVGATDEQLVVIGPRSDATAEDLLALGRALQRWQAEFPQARHIWGLSELLEGQTPRTPPIYMMVPFPAARFHECYEPVALVFVAGGTDHDATARDLYERLAGIRDKLAWFEEPDVYSFYNR